MAVSATFEVSEKAQKNIIALAQSVIARRNQFTEMKNKMEAIDQAYARYTGGEQLEQGLDATGKDVAGNTCCGNVFGEDNIVAPIVVAQVDTMVAYLADIFLSGYPIFPVVSSPSKRKTAEQMEVLLDDHAQLGGYIRQLMLMIKDGVKYNVSAIEAEWSSIEQFTVMDDFSKPDTGRTTKKVPKYFTKIKRLDMYNTVWDYSVSPGDVATEGDYAGYLEVISKTKLKRLLNKLSTEGKSFNTTEALNSWKTLSQAVQAAGNFQEHPTVSKYVTPRQTQGNVNWDVYLGAQNKSATKDIVNLYDGSSFEKFVLYARILPSDMGIKAPAANTPQIWKFTIINMSVVVSADRIISAYDTLPILMGQPMEDGLGYQTQSVAEGSIPFQEAATTLFNIRFSAARRAVSDRALYLPDMINPSDVNSPVAAAKIPVRLKALSNVGLDGAYKSIPFDMRGTESTINDARTIVGFSQELSGINGPQQGSFQKGNKSVQEWNDTIGGSDNRLRLPAMLYECQVFTPLKQILALNIFQYGEDAQLVSQKTGETVDVKIDELRANVLSFRVADGYSPKSKMASVEMLTAGMNMMMNSPALQQAYGSMLPNIFAHMMQLGGVRDMEQYSPEYKQETAPMALQQQTLQPAAPGIATDQTTGLPAAATPPSTPMP